MLGELNAVTKLLQKGKKTLAERRLYVDTLIDDVQKFRTNEFSKFYRCRLGKKCIAIDADIAPFAQFESGEVKIERGEESGMTDGEKSAFSNLLLEEEAEEPEAPNLPVPIVERIGLSKRRRADSSQHCINLTLFSDLLQRWKGSGLLLKRFCWRTDNRCALAFLKLLFPQGC